jgi:integrase
MQILPNADVRRIVAAAWEIDKEGGWSGDLARLVLVLAATGTRFSQAVRMTVADVQVEQKRLMIPTSRKGRGEKKITRTGFAVGDDVLDALRPAANGRVGSASLFLRPRFEAIAVANYVRAERGPWRASAEMAGPWREIVKRAGLAGNLTPYCLRHSSIVRGLRAGLPTRLIAQLHDTSSAMIEKYYAAQVTDALDELARRMITPLISATVTPIAAATA